MDKKHIIDSVRRRYPNIKLLRQGFAKYRVKKVDALLLSEDQIAAGEISSTEKARLVQMYLNRNNKLARSSNKGIVELVQKIPSLTERSDWEELRTDILFCSFAYGFLAEEYMCFGFETKSPQERKEFVSDVMRYRYVYQMNDLTESQVFNNKGFTYEKFRKYFKRDAVYIRSQRDFAKFSSFVNAHPEFVSKAVYEGVGRGIELINLSGSRKTKSELFRDIIAKGPHLLEERVQQNKVMAALNASSVNTVRVITFNTRQGIEIPYTFMKIGRAGSFVDNGGAGGILVGIDEKTGMLCTNGFDEMNRCYKTHPDSGVAFIGYQLPDWENLLTLSRKMSAQIPSVRYIGWDLAYTDQGWVVIEGNGKSQMIGPQIVFRRGIRAEVEALMNNMSLIV
ncbi:MAG: hypothetical protein IKI58_06510 [Oscillospiraceae bacterium]|nr:hypothetical protein [Oscillospiraceae bacterium]